MSEETICWSCKKACGKCPWSKELKPVDKWIAEKNNWSYIVHKCPLYEKAERKVIKINKDELRHILGCNYSQVNTLPDEYIVHKCKSCGYKIEILRTGKIRRFYLEV